MSSAYGHEIATIEGGAVESSKAFFRVYKEVKQVPHWNQPGALIWQPSCCGHDCAEKPVYVTRYSYVTGRKGRVTDRVQYHCATHGAAFAAKHKLQIPITPSA